MNKSVSSEMKILSKRRVTMIDVKRLCDKEVEWFNVIDYESDEHLIDQDYVILNVEYQEKKYIFIHGFPGDNAEGAFLDQDWNVIIIVGDGGPGDDNNVLSDWYYKITKEAADFSSNIFFV